MQNSTLTVTGIAIAVACSLAGAASAQGADTIFTTFRDACMVTGAEPAAVIRAADSHGWRTGDVAGKPIDGFSVNVKTSKTKKVGDTELRLFAWHGARTGIQVDECQIDASKAGFEAVRAAAAAALGFAAQESASPDKVGFSFDGPLDSPKPIDKSQYDEAAGAGGAYRLTVSKQGSGVFLELTRYRK